MRLDLPERKRVKMRTLGWTLLLLLAAAPLWARPKVAVRVSVNDGFAKKESPDSLSSTHSSYEGGLIPGSDYFLNVTVLSDNADAVAKNNGQWCIKGEPILGSIEYRGTLDGNTLEIEVPQKNGKTKRKTFVIFDHKWRKPSDI